MIPVYEGFLVFVGLTVGVAATAFVLRRRARAAEPKPRRILFPYVGMHLSIPALDVAVRISRVEHGTLVPVYLAPVPLSLPLDAPIPRVCDRAFELQEAIEQRAALSEVPVDGRIQRGRTIRHALSQALAAERYDRIVVAAASSRTDGLSSSEVAWLLEHAPAEVVVLRASEDPAPVTAGATIRRVA